VDISDKFFKISIFLADNGFITILKQLSMTLVIPPGLKLTAYPVRSLLITVARGSRDWRDSK